MSNIETLHKLAETLPECEIAAAVLLLKLYSAPWDDEPLTPEEIAAIEESRQEIARGKGIPMDEVKRAYRR